MKNKFLFVPISAVLLLTGCAVTTESIDIPYNSIQGVTRISEASAVTVSVQAQDERSDKSKVSSKKNAWGTEMAPILANQKVEITVRHAIEEELVSRGFKLTQPTKVKISVNISKFYNDFKVSMDAIAVADFHIDVVVVKSDTNEQIYHRQIATQGMEASSVMGGGNASLALSQALKNGIEMLFSDSAFTSALLSTAK